MKASLLWMAVIWFSVTAENARPDLLPSCSVVLPITIACIFWFRSGLGLALAGIGMLLRWLLQPETGPVEVWIILLLSTVTLTTPARSAGGVVFTWRRQFFQQWLIPILILGTAIITRLGAVGIFAATNAASIVFRDFVIALPLLAALLCGIELADTLGFRRPSPTLR